MQLQFFITCLQNAARSWYEFYILCFDLQFSGGRLNKKNGLARYGDSHVKDKTS